MVLSFSALISFSECCQVLLAFPHHVVLFAEMKSKPRADNLAMQSFLEEVSFKNSMQCGYVRNPFTNKQPKASTTEDVVQHVYHDKLLFSGAAGTILLPHT